MEDFTKKKVADELNSLGWGNIKFSARYLISLAMQNSDSALRSRLIYYLCQYYAVPLVMICQASYEDGTQRLTYVPEIALNMYEDRAGLFNFGIGPGAAMKMGKTQLLNKLILPTTDKENRHKCFIEDDETPFSNGQVDVFFQNCVKVGRRNFVYMDGQGSLKDLCIDSCLLLTNLALIHVDVKDLQKED